MTMHPLTSMEQITSCRQDDHSQSSGPGIHGDQDQGRHRQGRRILLNSHELAGENQTQEKQWSTQNG